MLSLFKLSTFIKSKALLVIPSYFRNLKPEATASFDLMTYFRIALFFAY